MIKSSRKNAENEALQWGSALFLSLNFFEFIKIVSLEREIP